MIKRHDFSQGFTLIEIMLVVMIVGIMAAGVSMIATRDRVSTQIITQTNLLQDTIRQVQARAMISQQFYGLTVYESGWQVVFIEPDEDFLSWGVPFQVQAQDSAQPTSTGESLSVDSDDEAELPWVPDARFSQVLLPKTLEVELFFEGSESSMLAEDKDAPPQIVFSAQGEVTPFVVLFRGVTGATESLLEVTADGRVVDIGVSELL